MIRGISGIEKKIDEKDIERNRNIDESFQDLKNLISKAKEMVELAQIITKKLKEKGNKDILQDEAILFRSDLLKLGLNNETSDLNEVSKKNYANKNKYYVDLGKSICKFIIPILKNNGGQLTLTDVYCTVNRARGLNLISTEDLLNACYTLDNNFVKMISYENGLIILQLSNYDQDEYNKETYELVNSLYEENKSGLGSNQLSIIKNCSIFIAKQKLLNCEKNGLLCRDESIQGLVFYPNKFLDLILK